MPRDPQSRPFRFERLEPRVLLSADALGGSIDADALTNDEDKDLANHDSQSNLETLLASLPDKRDAKPASPSQAMWGAVRGASRWAR